MKTLKLSFPRSEHYSWDWETKIVKAIEELGFEAPKVDATYRRYSLEPDPDDYEPWLEGVEFYETASAEVIVQTDFEGDALTCKIEELIESIQKEHEGKFELKVFEDGEKEPIMVF